MNDFRKSILGVPVDVCQPSEFLLQIDKYLKGNEIRMVYAINPEKIYRARTDPELMKALKNADLLIPDGVGTALCIQLLYRQKINRTTGIGLMWRLMTMASKNGCGIYLFGAKPSSNSLAAKNIKARFPSIKVAGFQHGYISNEEYRSLVEKINSSGADILFVGLGSPLQEKWLHKYQKMLKVKICIGVGGSFDVVSGTVPAAPDYFRKLGIEWLYRLLKEPKRFKRQLALPKFFFLVLRKRFLP